MVLRWAQAMTRTAFSIADQGTLAIWVRYESFLARCIRYWDPSASASPITAAPRLCPLETPTHAARQLTKSNLRFRKVARALKRLPVYYNSGGFLGQTLFDSKPGMHMFLELEEHWARAPCTPRLHV